MNDEHSLRDIDNARKFLIQKSHPDKAQTPEFTLDEIDRSYNHAISKSIKDIKISVNLDDIFPSQDIRLTISTATQSESQTVCIKYQNFGTITKTVDFRLLNICITLIIVVLLREQHLKVLANNNLEQHVQIPLSIALLGGEIEVEGIFGKKYSLCLKGGIQPGDKTVIENAGLPTLLSDGKNKFGNMFVVFDIKIPKVTNKNTRVFEL